MLFLRAFAGFACCCWNCYCICCFCCCPCFYSNTTAFAVVATMAAEEAAAEAADAAAVPAAAGKASKCPEKQQTKKSQPHLGLAPLLDGLNCHIPWTYRPTHNHQFHSPPPRHPPEKGNVRELRNLIERIAILQPDTKDKISNGRKIARITPFCLKI